MHTLLLLHYAYLVDVDDKRAMTTHHTRALEALFDATCTATQHIGQYLIVVFIEYADVVILRLEVVQ